MKFTLRFTIAVVGLAVTTMNALAHAENGLSAGPLHDIAHLFGGADHILGLAAFAVAMAAMLAIAGRRRRTRRRKIDGGGS